jgi:hypothetical protein
MTADTKAVTVTRPHPFAFSDDEIAQAIDAAGTPYRENRSALSRRVRDLGVPAGLPPYATLYERASIAASSCFGVELGTYASGGIYEYPAGCDGFNWHTDRLLNASQKKYLATVGRTWEIDVMRDRTISVMVQLSDPDDYEGGDLDVKIDGQTHTCSRDKGAVCFIRADVLHRVTPVTAGLRRSLVVFFGLPPRTAPAS